MSKLKKIKRFAKGVVKKITKPLRNQKAKSLKLYKDVGKAFGKSPRDRVKFARSTYAKQRKKDIQDSVIATGIGTAAVGLYARHDMKKNKKKKTTTKRRRR